MKHLAIFFSSPLIAANCQNPKNPKIQVGIQGPGAVGAIHSIIRGGVGDLKSQLKAIKFRSQATADITFI